MPGQVLQRAIFRSCRATRLRDNSVIVRFMGPDLIMATVEAAPAAVEQSLPDKPLRDVALEWLVKRHAQQRNWNRAIEFLSMMESDAEMTPPASNLLAALPRQEDRDRVFMLVLNADAQIPHRQVGTGSPDDLGTLVVRYWHKLTPSLVQQGIDELLKQSKAASALLIK